MLYVIFNVCFIPLICLYVETAKLYLEKVDRLFGIKHDAGKKMSWADAIRIARAESDDLQMYVEKNATNTSTAKLLPEQY